MKKVFAIFFSVCIVLFFISCGSKPAPEEPEPQPPVTEEIEESEVQESEQTENAENNEEDLSELMAKIDEARNAAIQEGADEKAPDLLSAVDNLYEKSKEDGLAGNADSLVDRYNLLAKYIKAKDAKTEIDENNLAGYAQKNYDAGTEDLQKVENAVKSAENISAAVKNSADNALSNFNTVISVAYKRMAKNQRDLAYAAKVNADGVKAGVSQKERYKIAADDFKNGDSLYSMQNPKKALEKYVSAEKKFTELYKEVSEKRAAAQTAIEAAKKKVLESSEYAAAADRDAPISEKIDGIEDDDTVLLEEDNYENPADAEAEIAENIDDEDFTENGDEILSENADKENANEENNAEPSEEKSFEINDDLPELDEDVSDDFVDRTLSENDSADKSSQTVNDEDSKKTAADENPGEIVYDEYYIEETVQEETEAE